MSSDATATGRSAGPSDGLPAEERRRLQQRLADVERHLREAPPHGGPARADLEATRRDLQRRLSEG